jgi:hypothetical protein
MINFLDKLLDFCIKIFGIFAFIVFCIVQFFAFTFLFCLIFLMFVTPEYFSNPPVIVPGSVTCYYFPILSPPPYDHSCPDIERGLLLKNQ